jgi:hypothetical protein
MPSSYTPLDYTDFVVGKPITFEEFQAVIENPTAIAEGATGAPRVVIPGAVSTTETNTTKALRPDGSGGVQWSAVPLAYKLTGSGNWSPPVTGTVIVLAIGGGGGGKGGDSGGPTDGSHGAHGQTIYSTQAVTAGVNVAYGVGGGGTAGSSGGGGGGDGGDTTFGSVTATGGLARNTGPRFPDEEGGTGCGGKGGDGGSNTAGDAGQAGTILLWYAG